MPKSKARKKCDVPNRIALNPSTVYVNGSMFVRMLNVYFIYLATAF
jgi:hypothetical protein